MVKENPSELKYSKYHEWAKAEGKIVTLGITDKPALPPRAKTYLKKARWAHSLKVVFERYFLFKLKRGAMNLP